MGNFILHPWQLYLAILASWINRQQQEVIEYLRTENQVLKERMGLQPAPQAPGTAKGREGWSYGSPVRMLFAAIARSFVRKPPKLRQ